MNRKGIYAAVLVYLCCSATFATTTTVTSVSAGRFAGAQTSLSDSNPSHSLLQVSKSALEGGTGSGLAEASASYGTLRADAGALGGGYASGGASAEATYSDIMKFDSAGMTGRAGSTTLNYWFNWDLDSSAAGNADAITVGTIDIRAGNKSSARGTMHFVNSANGTITNTETASNNGVVVPFSFFIPLTIDFIYGNEFSVLASLKVQAGAEGKGPDQFGRVNGSAYAQASAGHSLHWAGFTDTMAGNQLLTDYTVTSRSGTDWSLSQVPLLNSVPEPRSTLLFALGMVALCWTARRTRGRRES